MFDSGKRRTRRYPTQFKIKIKRALPATGPVEITDLLISKDLGQAGFGIVFVNGCPLSLDEKVELTVTVIKHGIEPVRFEASARVAWIRDHECGLQITEMKPEHRIVYEQFLNTLRS